MDSNLGNEPQSADGLATSGPSTMREQDSITSRSVLSRSTSMLTTLGLPEQKRSTKAPNLERSEFTMTNRFSMVFKVMSWRPLNRR